MNYPKMSKELVAKLIKGVKESPRVPEDIKKLLKQRIYCSNGGDAHKDSGGPTKNFVGN